MILYTPPKPADAIPVIDLSASFSDELADRRAVAWEIHKACRDIGFFYVENHGVPSSVLDRQLQWTRAFFDLSPAAKDAVATRHSPYRRGYEPMQSQFLDEGSPADLKESFAIATELPLDHPYVQDGVPGQGPNLWPEGFPGFRPQLEDYQRRMTVLGRRLLSLLALSLDLPEDYFAAAAAEPQCGVRLLRYPPQPDGAAFNQIGAGAHTDWGMITMLLQDGIGGLEAQNAAGEWIRATPLPGTLVINLGQMTERLTNGLYPATMHRVMNNRSGVNRHSVATFFDPDYFFRVDIAPTCLPADGIARYAPCTVGEHVSEMYRKTYGL